MRVSSGTLLYYAGLCMCTSLVCQNITVAGGNYRNVFLVSISCMLFADVCCVLVFFRGGNMRWIAVAIAIASLYIVGDCMHGHRYGEITLQ